MKMAGEMGDMTNEDLAAQLTTIAEHAPKLRKAGVTSLKLGAVELVLAPDDPPDAELFGNDDETDDQPSNPLDAPETFNRTDGTPSRRRRLINGESDHGDRD